jgi:hypothetical protein
MTFRCFAAGRVAPRPVAANAPADEDHDRNDQDDDENDDPRHLHPAWCAVIAGIGVVGRVGHRLLLSGGFQGRMPQSFTRQYVGVKSECLGLLI